MVYKKRLDGRNFDEMRPMKAKIGIIKRADGSALFQIGNTTAYVAVYGPRDLYPRFLKDPTKGVLRCRYNMLPFSGAGDRVRPGASRRSKEISMVTRKAILPALNLEDFPNSVVDVFIEFPQTDSGTRCAGICAASMALAHAGISMKDLVSSVAVGRVDDKILVDLTYAEETYSEDVADIPIAILPRTQNISLLQLDGEMTKEQLMQALELGKKACEKIYEIQKKALKERFKQK